MGYMKSSKHRGPLLFDFLCLKLHNSECEAQTSPVSTEKEKSVFADVEVWIMDLSLFLICFYYFINEFNNFSYGFDSFSSVSPDITLGYVELY